MKKEIKPLDIIFPLLFNVNRAMVHEVCKNRKWTV